MGPQPALKKLPNGKQVVWMPIRGGLLEMTPGNYTDSHLGEMVLDNSTVTGLQAGDIRWMNNDSPEFGTRFPSDEPPNPTIAGNYFFGGHWEAGLAREVTDRSDNRGSFDNPILTRALPHLVTSQDDPECPFNNRTHYCPNRLINTRIWPAGFYIYYNQGNVYDRYWSDYASWVVSNNTVYFVSTDGAIIALEHGDPLPLRPSQGNDEGVNAIPRSTPNATKAENKADNKSTLIEFSDADKYVGQVKTVEGIIQEIVNNGKAIYLWFKQPHQNAFVVKIPREYWENFGGTPEFMYQVGQKVHVTGKIEWYQGNPAIYVHQPSQIKVMLK